MTSSARSSKSEYKQSPNNNLKCLTAQYVGLTTETLRKRMNGHHHDTKIKNPEKPVSAHASTHNLNFEDCYTVKVMVEAKRVLTNILRIWPQNGFAMAHYGFILKVGDNNIEKSVGFLRHGIASREPGTLDGRFFFQLGDALMRLGRGNEALEPMCQVIPMELRNDAHNNTGITTYLPPAGKAESSTWTARDVCTSSMYVGSKGSFVNTGGRDEKRPANPSLIDGVSADFHPSKWPMGRHRRIWTTPPHPFNPSRLETLFKPSDSEDESTIKLDAVRRNHVLNY
uniref:Uncharacterized protein n=1 Tax=Timema poppense TaxID=170557 RepID=A0A7R9D6G2_TIMPO|nr:unnamed protein product [Timema poppensis]